MAGIPISSLPSYAQNFFAALMSFYTHAKFTVTAAALVAGVSFTVAYTVKGAGPFVSGSEVFALPGPSAGAGFSFLVAAVAFGVFKLVQARRSSIA